MSKKQDLASREYYGRVQHASGMVSLSVISTYEREEPPAGARVPVTRFERRPDHPSTETAGVSRKRRTFVQGRIQNGARVALAIGVLACAGGMSCKQATQGSPTTPGGAIDVTRVIDPKSSEFLVATQGDDAVVILASKDELGSVRAITGAAFIHGQRYFRYEVDSTGMPTRIATPDAMVLFGAYDGTSLPMYILDKNGQWVSEALALDAAAVEALRAPPPSLEVALSRGAVVRAAPDERPTLGNMIVTMWNNADCQHGVFSHHLSFVAAVGCVSTVLGITDFGAQEFADAFNGVSDVFACVTAAAIPLLGKPLALVACSEALEAFKRLLADEDLANRVLLNDFTLEASGNLIAMRPSQLTVSLRSRPSDVKLSSVIVNLSSVGGPLSQPLAYDGAMWSWSGTVTPPSSGPETISGVVDHATNAFAVSIDVLPPPPTNPIILTATAAPPRINLGDPVTLEAVYNSAGAFAAGWTVPPGYAWSAADVPRDGLSTIDRPTRGTLYTITIRETNVLGRAAQASVYVPVCGDSICDAEETATNCPMDCSPGGPPAPPNTRPGQAAGDPHLLSGDGLRTDPQPWGETTLVVSHSGDLEVQIRTHPLPGKSVSVITAVGASIDGHTVSFYLDRAPVGLGNFVDGKYDLGGGSAVWMLPSGYALVWSDNSQVRIAFAGNSMVVQVFLAPSRAGQVSGLLGNFNGDPTDDIATRDGSQTFASPVSFSDFYANYMKSWRIAQSHSLFVYAGDETTDSPTITNLDFPPLLQTTSTLAGADIQMAAAICRERGVPDDWMDPCELDVALSDFDASFADALAQSPQVVRTLDIQPPYGGPPQIGSVYPQFLVAGQRLTISGSDLATVTGDTRDVSVSLVAGQVSVPLTIASASSTSGTRLVVDTTTDLYPQISGAATVVVQTPMGTAMSTSQVTVMQSSGGSGSDGLFGAVYQLLSQTNKLPSFGSILNLIDPCSDPSIMTPCPLLTFDLPNLNIPSSLTTFPNFPQLTQYFAIRFRGFLAVDTPGTYQFQACVDDGANVYLFDPADLSGSGTGSLALTQVVAYDGLHAGTCSAPGTVTLSQGMHGIVVDYFQGPGFLGMQLLWKPPGAAAPVVIPASNLQAWVP